MKINETHIDSVIRIFASVLLLYVGFSGELAGALAIMAVVLGVDPANLPNFYWKTGSGIYTGRVDLWAVNADANPELVNELKVYGIPTLIGYDNGKEVRRHVGAKSRIELQTIFESLSTGSVPNTSGLSHWDRFIRLVAGGIVIGMGWLNHCSWLLLALGGILMFTAIYDRCPVWKASTTLFKKIAWR